MILVQALVVSCLSGYWPIAATSEKDVEYYEQMLTRRMKETMHFVLPTDNRRYFGDYIPDEDTAEGEFS